MRAMQDRQVAAVLKRQRETEAYYEKKLKKTEKELREARKRIVERRNQMGDQIR
jgi:peptidoglycan hydrolase CwlO-like protein